MNAARTDEECAEEWVNYTYRFARSMAALDWAKGTQGTLEELIRPHLIRAYVEAQLKPERWIFEPVIINFMRCHCS